MSETVYIYGLREVGTTEIRYVGQTIYPKERLSSHRQNTNITSSHPKAMWIAGVLARGSNIEMHILEECTPELAFDREYFWMEHYRNTNGCLTNVGPAQRKTSWQRQDVRSSLTIYTQTENDGIDLDAFRQIESDMASMRENIRKAHEDLRWINEAIRSPRFLEIVRSRRQSAAVARLEARQA